MLERTKLLTKAIIPMFLLSLSATPSLASGLQSWIPAPVNVSRNYLTVYPGCALPNILSGTHTFYVDPIRGSDANDGSSAHPWQSLQSTVTNKIATSYYTTPYTAPGVILSGRRPTGALQAARPVRAGDTILLATGFYGPLFISGVNADFITIAAAYGARPVFSSVTVNGASKFVLQGLKVQGAAAGIGASLGHLVSISDHSFVGPVDNIIFDNGNISTADSLAGWSANDWVTKAMSGVSADGGVNGAFGACIAITNTKISNVKFGIGFGITGMLLYNDAIDNFGDDGVDYNGTKIIISHLRITNSNTIGDGNHNDAMQGAIGRMALTVGNHDILIDGNTIIRQTTPALPFPGGLQGIDAFDSEWYDLTVTNNVVITNAWHGISFYSLHRGLIANNTVLGDGIGSSLPWIGVFNTSHEGTPSDHVEIRNNLADSIVIDKNSDKNTITADNNRVAYNLDEFDASGVFQFYQWTYSKGIVLRGGNVIDRLNLTTDFVGFDPRRYDFDVRLRATSPANGFGSAATVPPTDIVSTKRKGYYDLGAYAYVPLG